MAANKKKAPVKRIVSSPKKSSISDKKTVIKKPVAKTVTKKEAAPKTSDVKGEVVPKVLTGEGLRRRRIAALKDKK